MRRARRRASASSAWRRRSCPPVRRRTPTSWSTANPRRRCARSRAASASGVVDSPAIHDLDALPFPRWDLVRARDAARWSLAVCAARPVGGAFPVLASRSCPEFCTYCPHRILAAIGTRSVANIVDELESLLRAYARGLCGVPRSAVHRRPRTLPRALRRHPGARPAPPFECETRLDRLDATLLDTMHRGRPARDELRRRVAVARRRSSVPAGGRFRRTHQRRIIERLPATRHRRPPRSTCSAFCRTTGTRSARRSTTPSSSGSTVAQFKMLTPYPGHAAVETARRRSSTRRTGSNSTASRRRSRIPT